MTLDMKKDEIRHRIRANKALLTNEDKAIAADKVFDQLEKLAAFIMSNRILMYHSLPDELSTIKFIKKWDKRKSFFLPRVNGLNLEILPFDQSKLSLGAFQIEEPQGDDTTDISSIEMIVVPAVAYDRNCNRVGRGKGYYDRLLAGSKALRVGIAYDFQVVDDIETDEYDVPVDILITESHTYIRKRNNRG